MLGMRYFKYLLLVLTFSFASILIYIFSDSSHKEESEFSDTQDSVNLSPSVNVNQDQSSPTISSEAQSHKEEAVGGISEAELYQIQLWSSELGWSEEQMQTYRSYDDETLLKLANEGDIYALHEAHHIMRFRGYPEKANDMLVSAATRGSTFSFTLSAISISHDIQSLRENNLTEEEARSIYPLAENASNVERELEKWAAVQYSVAMLRGDVVNSDRDLKLFARDTLSSPFSDEEWSNIYQMSRSYLQSLEDIRSQLGLPSLDNQYPEEYAKAYGLPEENPISDKMDAFIESYQNRTAE